MLISPQLTVHPSTRLPRVKIPENYLTDPSKSCSINKLTSSISKLQQPSHPTVSYLYDEFCSLILQEIPVKPKLLGKGPRGRNKKWWDSELSSARSKLRKACKSWLKCKSNTDNKQEFIRAQKAFDSLVRKKKRNYQHSSMLHLLLQQKQNSRQFWKKVKKLGVAGIESQSIPMEVELEDGSISSDKSVVMSKWLASFKSLLNPESGSSLQNYPLDPTIQSTDSSELNTPITKDEVKTALHQAPSNKALGIDNIDPSYLNHNSIIDFLLSLFNHCLLKGGCPAAWKKALIFPIHKSGQSNKRDPLSYRGISLQSTVLKLYTYILNQRLSRWLEENNILSDLQNGFRPQRSCQDHMLSLYNIILNRKLSGSDTFCCYVDFKKAFDSVNRERLWDKLARYGINGPFLSTLQSLYEEYQCCVEVNGNCTPWFEVNNGVKQGCILSPSLFNLYINDLLKKLGRLGFGVHVGCDGREVGVPALAFADDIALVAPTPNALQSMLTTLEEWCMNNGIAINISKTKIMHFRKKRQPCSTFNFICSNSKIEYCSEYKYLGL